MDKKIGRMIKSSLNCGVAILMLLTAVNVTEVGAIEEITEATPDATETVEKVPEESIDLVEATTPAVEITDDQVVVNPTISPETEETVVPTVTIDTEVISEVQLEAEVSEDSAVDETSLEQYAAVDKTKLQTFYDQVKDYDSDDDFYDEFKTILDETSKTLDNTAATQDEVDACLDKLEQRYWLSNVNAYVKKYKPIEKGSGNFDYTKYEASSTIPVLNVYVEARNHTNTSYPAEELKILYDGFVEAEKQLKSLSEIPESIMVGPSYEMINTVEHKGNFTFSEKTENGKIILNIAYDNNGLNPITGNDLEKFNSYQLSKKLSVYLDYDQYDGKASGSKPITSYVKPLDGESDLIKGFQIDVEVEPGVYSISMRCDGSDTLSFGSYYTARNVESNIVVVKVDDPTDEAAGTAALKAALETIQDGQILRFESDITVDEATTFVIDKDIKVEGQGHSITRNSLNATTNMIECKGANVELNNIILDCKGLCKNVLSISAKSNVIITEGSIIQSKKASNNGNETVLVSDSKLIIENGTIQNSSKVGLKLENNSEAILNNGNITNNGAAGVSVKDSIFTMDGGAITNNTQAGVTISSGNIQLNSGEVSGNSKYKKVKQEISFASTADVDSSAYFASGVLGGSRSLSYGVDSKTITLAEGYKDITFNVQDKESFEQQFESITGDKALLYSQPYSFVPTSNSLQATFTNPSDDPDIRLALYHAVIDENGVIDENTLTKVNLENSETLAVNLTNLTIGSNYVLYVMETIAPQITSLELSVNNKGQIYVKNGESYQLEALDQDGNPVDTTLLNFKANDVDGNIAVNDSGLVTGVKESTSTNDKTQIRIELKTNPDIYTYINVVEPMSPVIDKLNVANGKTTDYLPEYDGGAISDTASKLYYFNIEGNAEWRNDLDDDNYTKKGLPTIDWYLDGEKVTTTQFDWYRATQHDAGMVNPKTRAEIDISTYGEHTVKVVLTGLDGATVEKEIKVNRTPIWLNDNHAVKRITKDAGDVVIPEVVNGYDITALDASETNDKGVESGITSLVIPETVTSISSNFFKTPTDLASIEFKGNVPASENLDLSRMILSEGCLKAPEGQEQAFVEYANAHNWNKGTSPLSWEELFGLDVKAPVIEGVTEGMLTNKDVTYSSKDTDLDKVILDGKEYTWDNAPKTVTTEGKHTLVVSDKSGNTTTINFTIDKTAPIINASDKQITVGDKFDPKAGVTAKDGDEDLTSSIEVKGSVNTSDAGKYTIVYSVMDKAGNRSEKSITVIVKDKATKPNSNGGIGTWDDGGPFTTDVCGNVFDRWGNKIYSAPACEVSDGYLVPNTGVK